MAVSPVHRPSGLDPEAMLDQIGAHLESVFSGAGMEPTAAKIAVVELLLATGTEDEDHHYVDDECNNLRSDRLHAVKIAQAVTRQPPEDPAQLESLGMSLIKLLDYDHALECFSRQSDRVPESGYPWNNIAWCQFRRGWLEEAEAACQKALKALPNHSCFWHTHACILMESEKLDESLRAIDHAIVKLSPKAPQLHYLRACVLERRKDTRAAVGAWKTYLKEVRAFPSHFRAMNRALEHLQALRAGLSDWRVRRLRAKMGPPRTRTAPILQALGLDVPDDAGYPPAQDEFRSAQADQLAQRGWQRLQRGNRSGAQAKCRKALTCWPFSPLTRVLDARLALQRKDEDAYHKHVVLANLEQLFAPAAEARLHALVNFVFLMSLVNAEKMYHDGNYCGARSQLDEVDRVVPNHPTAIFLRGLVLAAQGDKAGARSLASRLREQNGDKRAIEMLMRVGREYVPRETASASSPVCAPPSSFRMGRGYGFHRW
jgi:tetratricopeptide (TPR) repeat protein